MTKAIEGKFPWTVSRNLKRKFEYKKTNISRINVCQIDKRKCVWSIAELRVELEGFLEKLLVWVGTSSKNSNLSMILRGCSVLNNSLLSHHKKRKHFTWKTQIELYCCLGILCASLYIHLLHPPFYLWIEFYYLPLNNIVGIIRPTRRCTVLVASWKGIFGYTCGYVQVEKVFLVFFFFFGYLPSDEKRKHLQNM